MVRKSYLNLRVYRNACKMLQKLDVAKEDLK